MALKPINFDRINKTTKEDNESTAIFKISIISPVLFCVITIEIIIIICYNDVCEKIIRGNYYGNQNKKEK